MTASAAAPDSTHAAKSRRDLLLVIALMALALVGWTCLTPFGGWVQSFFFGSGVRWQNAYVALDAAENNLPRNERERERLLTVTAMAESAPPIGFKMGPRLHPPGMLATLRYEIFDENGAAMDKWDVRALVPNIGNGEGPFWREPCAKACRDEIAHGNGTHIQRSGEAGIAEEYVLRMPVGQTFSLKPTPLRMHDILDTRERSVPLRTVRVDRSSDALAPDAGGTDLRPAPVSTQDVIDTVPQNVAPAAGFKSVQVPSKILVTLVAACKAEVRVGTAMNLEFAGNAVVPVPTGFVVSRWAQLDGCGKLAAFDSPPIEPAVTPARVVVEPPDLHAVIAQRDPRTGAAALKVDEAWLRKENMPVVFNLTTVCRYDPAADQWRRLPPPERRAAWRLVPLSNAGAASGNRIVYELPREAALFWLHWMEQREVNAAARPSAYHAMLVLSGPVQCNDVALGPAPPGKIAVCVPFANRAEARFVPAPAKPCSE